IAARTSGSPPSPIPCGPSRRSNASSTTPTTWSSTAESYRTRQKPTLDTPPSPDAKKSPRRTRNHRRLPVTQADTSGGNARENPHQRSDAALHRGFRPVDVLGEERRRRAGRRPPADRQRRAAAAAEVPAGLDRDAA